MSKAFVRTPVRRIIQDSSIAAGITLLLSLFVFWPMRAKFFDPWAAGDLLSTYVAADNWGFFASSSTTQYGFPLGMNANLVPGIDITENIFAKIVNLMSGNPYFGINLLLALSFPIVAALAVIALRLVGSRGFIAITLAVAFAFIPYHWGRGLGHFYLASLYSVVTGMILVLLMSSGRFTKMVNQRKKLQLAGVAALVVVTAWTGLYYAVFAIILMSAALLWRFAKKDSWKQLALNVIPIAATALLVIVGFLPGLIATFINPPFAVLSERTPYESVMFAGFLISALIPAPIFPTSFLSFYNTAVTEAINVAPAFENRVPTNFGTIVTFVSALLFVWAMFARARYVSWAQSTKELPLIGYLLVISVLFFIPWGLNYAFASLLTAQVRAWNRFLPIILLLLILAAGVVLKRVSKHHTIAILTAAGLGATFVNSVYPFKENYVTSATTASTTVNAARDYALAVNTAVPPYCAVLQLPFLAYPENGPLLELDDYGHFWQPINDKGKAWSYGAIKNTEAGYWSAKLPEIPTPEQVQSLTDAGFCGIHIDTRGYVAPAAQRITAELQARYGAPIATGNPDPEGVNTWFFYRLPGFQPIAPLDSRSARTQEFFLAPALSTLSPNDPAMSVAPRGSKDGLTWWWTTQPTATFTLHQINPRFPITGIELGLRSSGCETASATLSLTDPAGEQISEPVTVEINPTQTTQIALTSDPVSEATLTISTTGQGCTVAEFPYPQFVQVINPTP